MKIWVRQRWTLWWSGTLNKKRPISQEDVGISEIFRSKIQERLTKGKSKKTNETAWVDERKDAHNQSDKRNMGT